MSDPAGVIFDGDHETAFQDGATVWMWDKEKQSYLAAQKWRVRAPFFAKLDWDTPGPVIPGTVDPEHPTDAEKTYLVEETEPQALDADVVEWTRIYAAVPPARSEGQGFVMQLQFIIGTDLVELPIPGNSRLLYEYFLEDDPFTLTIYAAQRIFKNGELFYVVGGGASPIMGWTVAEDSTLSRWRGNIWQRVTRLFVPSGYTES